MNSGETTRLLVCDQAVFERQISSTSYVLPATLQFGQYRFWVRAVDSSAQPSRWSSAAAGIRNVVQIGPLLPTFNLRPRFEWNPVRVRLRMKCIFPALVRACILLESLGISGNRHRTFARRL